MPWQKVLLLWPVLKASGAVARYLKQPYEDNYVDESFLDSLILNAHLQKYEPRGRCSCLVLYQVLVPVPRGLFRRVAGLFGGDLRERSSPRALIGCR